MKNKINKRGGDKVISVYWFAILFLVAAGVSYMVIGFYGKPYDVRALEVDALIDKAANCVSQAGYINEQILISGFTDLTSGDCGFVFSTEDVYGWNQTGQYYLEISILDFDQKNVVSFFASGNHDLKESCDLKGQSLPVCSERKFYTIDKENKQYEVKILSVIRKTEKNVQ